MRLLSPILQRIVYPVLGKAGYFHSRASAAIVTYHGVLPETYRSTDSFVDNTLLSIGSFRSQLKLLKKHYNLISPEHFLRWLKGSEQLPGRALLLTCDDGLLNNLTVMLPVLQEERSQCLFFVTGQSTENRPAMLWYVELYLILMAARGTARKVDCGSIVVREPGADVSARRAEWQRLMNELSRLGIEERCNVLDRVAESWGLDCSWKQRFLDDPVVRQRFQLLRPSEVNQLADAGMTIGSHTMSHPILSTQPAEFAQSEIANCRQKLEQCTGRAVWALAYPFGNAAAVGNRELDLARAAGYDCAFMNVPGDLQTARRFALPRVHVTAEMSLDVYEAHVSGFHEEIRRRFAASRSRQSGISA